VRRFNGAVANRRRRADRRRFRRSGRHRFNGAVANRRRRGDSRLVARREKILRFNGAVANRRRRVVLAPPPPVAVTAASMGPSPTGDGEPIVFCAAMAYVARFNGAVANRRRRDPDTPRTRNVVAALQWGRRQQATESSCQPAAHPR